MQEETNQDNQKTIVAFVVGLLIGGLLVWAFSGPSDQPKPGDKQMSAEESSMTDESEDSSVEDEAAGPKLMVGNGDIVVEAQPASRSITIEKAEYPVAEGWIGVREYNDGELGYILGVNRFSESQGLVPEQIELVRATTAGTEYAIVVYQEDGDFDFSTAGDVQLETVFDTFTAQ